MVLGFLLAAWVFRLRDLPGMGLVRTLLTMPILVAPVVAAVMWRFMYQPDFGVHQRRADGARPAACRLAVGSDRSRFSPWR